ncbi:metal-dependent hydrolase [Halolamina salifodinae]|uniref:Inner membrane protein n=1 Tax=Halolamina salifodinae TaxID=1202767 RepID=A0A8T4GXQ3_9EURY|nr:metal-dependent hydrolase [Halolamina salifodinae]MBP1986972.1 inner membrane protein [Halolamina salifodinae]
MYGKGHQGLAMLLFAPILFGLLYIKMYVVAAIGFFVCIGLATYPDIDWSLPFVKHRGITHTLFGAVVLAIVFGVGVYLLMPKLPSILVEMISISRGWLALIVGAFVVIAIVFHLIGDWLTKSGIQPFSPMKKTRYAAGVTTSANPFVNIVLYFIGLFAIGTVIYLSIF